MVQSIGYEAVLMKNRWDEDGTSKSRRKLFRNKQRVRGHRWLGSSVKSIIVNPVTLDLARYHAGYDTFALGINMKLGGLKNLLCN